MHMDSTVEQELQRMCSSEKKVDFLDALHCYRNVLDCIPLPEGSVDPFQTRKDTIRENVVLNGDLNRFPLFVHTVYIYIFNRNVLLWPSYSRRLIYI